MADTQNATRAPSDLLPANSLAKRLRANELSLALMVKHARVSDIALAARTCGYDALYLDMQHTTIAADVAAHICVAALGAGITPLVRVPGGDYELALRMLDAGALGIIFPDISSAKDAQLAVDACMFGPLGHRSTSASWPHFGYRPLGAVEAQRIHNANTVVVVMIESLEGLEHVEEIAAVPGVGIVHIGCGDLASAMGIPGQREHPDLLAAVQRVVAACRAHGVAAGLGGFSSGDLGPLSRVLACGPTFVTAANEWSLMMSSMQARADAIRAVA